MGCSDNPLVREFKEKYRLVVNKDIWEGVEHDHDDITRTFLVGCGKVAVADDAKRRAVELFGHELTDLEWLRLAQAPDGAQVTVRISPSSPSRALQIITEHPLFDFPSIIHVSKRRDGQLIATADQFGVSPQAPRSFGTRLFAYMVMQAKLKGVAYIVTEAAREFTMPDGETRDANGYYTWARWGANCTLSNDFYHIPEQFRNKELVDIMQTEDGRRWWRDNGQTEEMIFDLRGQNKSLDTLFNYLTEQRITL